MLPEKTEVGVVSRGDRMEALLSLPLKPIARLISEAVSKGIDVKEIFEQHRLGTQKTNKGRKKD
tara:strand:- start:5444 stop:5635 length:192 start_codon:yes stop_codon:yes gene_type:complete